MFRLFRNRASFAGSQKVIPLELNYYDAETKDFSYIGSFPWADKITLRAFYYNEKGDIVARIRDLDDSKPNWNKDVINPNVQEVVIDFYRQIFENMIGLK